MTEISDYLKPHGNNIPNNSPLSTVLLNVVGKVSGKVPESLPWPPNWPPFLHLCRLPDHCRPLLKVFLLINDRILSCSCFGPGRFPVAFRIKFIMERDPRSCVTWSLLKQPCLIGAPSDSWCSGRPLVVHLKSPHISEAPQYTLPTPVPWRGLDIAWLDVKCGDVGETVT